MCVHKYLRRCKEDGAFCGAQWQDKKKSTQMEAHMTFHLNIINMKVVKYWDPPSLEILKTQLETALKTCSSWPWREQGTWTRWSPKVPSNINCSLILWHPVMPCSLNSPSILIIQTRNEKKIKKEKSLSADPINRAHCAFFKRSYWPWAFIDQVAHSSNELFFKVYILII